MNLWWKSTTFFKKCQIRELSHTFWIFLETLKTRIVLILKIVVLILILKITQPWLLANVEIRFQKFEGEKESYTLAISWPKTAVLWRFQWYFCCSDTSKDAWEGQMPISMAFDLALQNSTNEHQRHLLSALYNRKESVFVSLLSFHTKL